MALRVLQGVGAALMLPGTLAVITDAYADDRQRARVIGVWAGIGSVALPAGPLLGGALTQAVGWRAVFFINVPVVLLAIAVAAVTVQDSGGRTRRRLDLPGVVLGGALLAAITFAFIQAGHAGLNAAVVIAVIAAVGLGTAFVVVERSREEPTFPLALFRRATFSAANTVAGVMNCVTLGLLFVLTLYLQDVRHLGALSAGLALLPLFLPLSVMAPFTGRLTARIGARWPMIGGLGSAAVGIALIALTGASSAYLELLPALLLWGIGLGLLTPAVVAAAVASVPGGRSGLASAVNNTARQAGGAIGIAAFGAIAGAPASHRFLSGFHTGAILGAGLFVVAAAATLILVRD